MTFYVCTSKIFKNHVLSNHLNLCEQVENSKWIMCSLKSDFKCGYLRFVHLQNQYTFIEIMSNIKISGS